MTTSAACATTPRPSSRGLDEVQEMGRIHDRNQSDFLDGEIAKGAGDDISVMLYTSGTTGKPKGFARPTPPSSRRRAAAPEFDRLTDREDILSYLPMAWVGDHLFSFAQAMVAGFTINCPESGETVMTDLREIGPTYYFAPPRVFENLLTQVAIRMEDASWIKRTIFHKYLGWRGAAARTSSTASRSRPATACSTGSAACWCTARSRTCSA